MKRRIIGAEANKFPQIVMLRRKLFQTILRCQQTQNGKISEQMQIRRIFSNVLHGHVSPI